MSGVWRDGGTQVRGRDSDEWLDTILVLGFWASIAAYAWVAAPGIGFAGARYLGAPLLYGVTLAGRRARDLGGKPPDLGQARAGFRPLLASAPVVRRAGAGLLVVLLALYLGTSLRLLGQTEPADPDTQLAATLIARHLEFGYAPYWIASNTVLHSKGRLTILPVESVGGRLRAFDFYADTTVLRRRPPAMGATFVVYRADTGWGNVDTTSARASFGEPANQETIGPYTLLTWKAADLNGRAPDR